ncbi:GNAT family N-acetyltransferase (plasmid) [Deinococcus metallilatus]|uniref:GNAT family N-acetyltransferase n=1 Tax=Deinococcus metallilatus TaxID=1211322 RepID=A0AAJ5JZU3_9DEIO|nr:GNAT family N-acetyltransferase [Deinococcus metallilatus]MBB5293446.1 ribosomal protein S18 acetylase RimI-like enzyme [Deinococcus metallilatus]QBY06534.1 GNAT family N-acetyltransferase [Deinococcus metallilatus]RXJ17877.1 GNAT family N-acetyltransferase [Deinococcus metallilatus]TLK32149.1 GNAT family N-acetyltransferase [Deinococcus metallilatus]GMA15334.1 N-acetyltransferase [Deinococcus metallilatus]
MTPSIHPATEQDIPQLLPLMRALAEFEDYLDVFAVNEDILREQGFRKNPPDFHALVADEDGTLVGMLVYYLVPFTATARPTLYVKELYVAEEARGQHIGEHLMRAAAREATTRGCGALRWTVANWNTSGQRFYERLGARANPVWTDYGLSGPALTALAEITV